MTLPVDLYPWFALASSVAIVALFGAHVIDATRNRHRFHDDKAAVDLLVAWTLLVASLGLLLSALASFGAPFGVDGAARSEIRNAGLALVRGVLVATALVMVITDRRVPRRA